jgi:hypothetical protein
MRELFTMACIAQGNLEKALQIASTHSFSLTMSQYIVAIARIYIAEDKLDHAYEAIRKLNDDLPLKNSTLFHIARLHNAKGQFKQALDVSCSLPERRERDALLIEVLEACMSKKEHGFARSAALNLSHHDEKLRDKMLERTNRLLLVL